MYKIYSLIKDGKVVYVGRTSNLTKRVKQHKRDKDFDTFVILGTAEELKCASELEDRFIMIYNPKYNKALNSCGAYIKLGEVLKGRFFDTAAFIKYMRDYNVKPVFFDNYSDNTINIIIDLCELKDCDFK